MVLEYLLRSNVQIQGVPALDGLPDTELTKYLRQYLLACRAENKSPHTLWGYGDFIGYFIRFLAANKMTPGPAAVTPDHIRIYVVSLQERRLSPETINAYYRALHTFFNWLTEQEHIEKNPFEKLHAPKMPHKLVKAFPQEVVTSILKLSFGDTSFAGRRNLAMVLVFLDTGIRQQEMTQMQLGDFLPNQGLLKVMGKGGKERIVKVGKSAERALLQYLVGRKDHCEAMWVTEEGLAMKAKGIDMAIRRLGLRAGVPKSIKLGTHTYRHTAATSYLRNGGNIKCLQEMLGHEHITTTMKYVDALGPELLIKDHEAASPVDNLLRGGAVKSRLAKRR